MMRKIINEDIHYKKFILIGEDGKKLGIVTREEGLKIAQDKGLDLLLVNDKDRDAVVCRICNAGKFIYNIEKKNKNKAPQIKQKDLSLKINIDPKDFKRKCEQVKGMMEDGHKVKFAIFFARRDFKNEEESRRKAREKIEEIISYLQQFDNIDMTKQIELKSVPNDDTNEDGKRNNNFFIIFKPIDKVEVTDSQRAQGKS